jgi:hypothetical protein
MQTTLLTHKLFLLIILSILIRLLIFFIYIPIGYADSGWYYDVAKQIARFDFTYYDGARTPVYPVVIILGFLKWKLVWIIQLIMGVVNSILIYKIMHKLSGSDNLSFYTGLTYNLSLTFLFFESNLLTETTCILFILLTILFFIKTYDNVRLLNYFYLSLFLSLAALTRPAFLYLFPLVFLFLFLTSQQPAAAVYDKYRWKRIIAFSIPFIVIIGGWSTFNKIQVNYFGPTTLTGFHLIEHSGAFIEYAPDEYSDIKNIYLKNRSVKISETGEQTTTIYMAYPEIQKIKNYSIGQVSKDLTKISLWLFWHYPGLYSKSVMRAYSDYWYLPNFINYWEIDKIKSSFLCSIFRVYIFAELRLWIAVNIIFLFFCIYNAIQFVNKKNIPYLNAIVLIEYIVLCLSVIQALVQYGDNWRFGVAVKPLIILSLFLNIYYLSVKKKITADG